MKNGKYTQFLIDLVVLFLSVKTGSFICSILERTSINVWIARGTGALVAAVVGLLCPVCGSKTRDRIKANTDMKNFPLYCPKCKKETIIAAVLCLKR